MGSVMKTKKAKKETLFLYNFIETYQLLEVHQNDSSISISFQPPLKKLINFHDIIRRSVWAIAS